MNNLDANQFCPYRTIHRETDIEFTERKSLFIGHAKPVSTESEAIDYIAKQRTRYRDATHNVYAYRLRNNHICRYSDDGEPQGTAGLTVLDIIRKNDLYDICLVVTRYFGGILLGTGGLVRAYSKSAKSAVDQAEILSAELFLEFEISAGYSDFEKIQREAASFSAVIEHVQYEATVSASFSLRPDVAEKFCFRVSELSAGRVRPIPSGERLILRPVDCKA